MKYLSLLVLFTSLSLQFGFSQIKKQFLDAKNAKTTVVIKEDAASDMAILNSQFDLNAIGMGQEIRITTQKDRPKPPKAEMLLAEVPIKKVTPKAKKVVKKAAVKKVVKQKRMPARAVATMPRTKKKPTEIYYKGVGKSSKKKVKMKKRKLVKRKKIRKRKRRRVRCYSF